MCSRCQAKTLIDLGDTKLCGSCWMLHRVDLTPIVDTQQDPADSRPDLPAKPIVKDIVFDIAEDNGTTIFASRTYCPREDVYTKDFDPNDPHFKFYLKMYRKRFKNRRRYMYDKQRKMTESMSGS